MSTQQQVLNYGKRSADTMADLKALIEAEENVLLKDADDRKQSFEQYYEEMDAKFDAEFAEY